MEKIAEKYKADLGERVHDTATKEGQTGTNQKLVADVVRSIVVVISPSLCKETW